MKLRLWGASLAVLALIPAALMAQAPAPGAAPGAAPAAPRPDLRSFPTPRMIAGMPFETRDPELSTDKPAFPGQTRAPYRKTVDLNVTTLTSGLKSPWSLAFLAKGRMLVTEKPGTMRIVDANGAISGPISGVPAVIFAGQGGLLDLALDPAYARNHRIFFSYSAPVGADLGAVTIASATLDETALALSNVKTIFQAKPAQPKTRVINIGGRIAIGRDGSLFATMGDWSNSPPWDMAQKLDTHLGKMIHITADGAPGKGNPFVKTPGAMPEIWSLGHRSEEGLTVDANGRLWETEHGPRGGDELNTPEAGKNYGWPVIVHGIDYPGPQINGGFTEKAGLEQPHYYWDPVIAPSGLAVYNGSMFPQWKGNVLVGALRGTMISRLTMNGDKVVDEEPLLYDLKLRIRDVRVGPEGAVYALSDDGKLLRVTPKSK